MAVEVGLEVTGVGGDEVAIRGEVQDEAGGETGAAAVEAADEVGEEFAR